VSVDLEAQDPGPAVHLLASGGGLHHDPLVAIDALGHEPPRDPEGIVRREVHEALECVLLVALERGPGIVPEERVLLGSELVELAHVVGNRRADGSLPAERRRGEVLARTTAGEQRALEVGIGGLES